MSRRNRLMRLSAEIEVFFKEGKKAFADGMPLHSCEYGISNPKAMCAWKGGWVDAKNESGEDHSNSLRSCL